MKKVLLSFVLYCTSIVGMAQTDVTKFLGIPVDGSKSEMMRKFKSKGFTQRPYAEGYLQKNLMVWMLTFVLLQLMIKYAVLWFVMQTQKAL